METQTQYKKCRACHENFPLRCFGMNKISSDGYNSRCISCRNILRRFSYNSQKVDEVDLPFTVRNKILIKELISKSEGKCLGKSSAGEFYEVTLMLDPYWIKVMISRSEELEAGFMGVVSNKSDLALLVTNFLNSRQVVLTRN